MTVTIKAGRAAGTVSAPASKSRAHRMIIGAALSNGVSVLRSLAGGSLAGGNNGFLAEGKNADSLAGGNNGSLAGGNADSFAGGNADSIAGGKNGGILNLSEDISATLDCAEAMGAAYSFEGDALTVRGINRFRRERIVFPCRESGSTLRFFLPLAAIGGNALFTGTARLMERGVGVYEDILPQKGVKLRKTDAGVEVTGELKPGEFKLRGDVSSQFVTGLMLALPLLDGDSVINVTGQVESRAYIDVTLDTLRGCGVLIEETSPNVFSVSGGQSYTASDWVAEGDWSNAAFLYAFNELGGEVEAAGLRTDSIQGDRVCVELLRSLRDSGQTIDISGCPDLGPVLFAVAAANKGGRFTGTHRLRIKECDRAAAMAGELAKFGAEVSVGENEVVVSGGGLHSPTTPLFGHNDHRVVMALSLLASVYGASIEGAEAVRKSWPEFFEVLTKLGLEVIYGS